LGGWEAKDAEQFEANFVREKGSGEMDTMDDGNGSDE